MLLNPQLCSHTPRMVLPTCVGPWRKRRSCSSSPLVCLLSLMWPISHVFSAFNGRTIQDVGRPLGVAGTRGCSQLLSSTDFKCCAIKHVINECSSVSLV